MALTAIRLERQLRRRPCPWCPCTPVPGDSGAEHWAVLASLIETCKLNRVDPQGYLADVISRIVGGHSLDELLPWAYRAASTSLRSLSSKITSALGRNRD